MSTSVQYNFKGKVALVTGGTSGIGLSTAELLAQSGASVVICGTNAEQIQREEKRLKDLGYQVLGIRCDVSKSKDVEEMFQKIESTFGKVDIAVNNAGICVRYATDEMTEEEWDQIINVNLKGAWLCMKYALQHMLAKGSGAIVNVSSTAGIMGDEPLAAYVASKHGVVGLTKATALEYAKRNIRVNVVCPGWIETPLTAPVFEDNEILEKSINNIPIGRAGQPQEVAEAIVWLCSDAASLVTGAVFPVDGAHST